MVSSAEIHKLHDARELRKQDAESETAVAEGDAGTPSFVDDTMHGECQLLPYMAASGCHANARWCATWRSSSAVCLPNDKFVLLP